MEVVLLRISPWEPEAGTKSLSLQKYQLPSSYGDTFSKAKLRTYGSDCWERISKGGAALNKQDFGFRVQPHAAVHPETQQLGVSELPRT